MGIFRNIKERVRGREFWRNINRALILIIYTILLLGALLFRQYLYIPLIVLAIFIPSYSTLFINHLRNMEKDEKGNEVFGGWTEHRHGKGELKYFYPEEILPYTRLSEIDQASVDDFLVYITILTKEQIRMSLIAKETKEPPKLLMYEERVKMEQEELDDLKKEFEETYLEGTTIKVENQGEFFEINGESYPNELISKFKSLGKVPIRRGKFTKSFKEWCNQEKKTIKTENQGEEEDE